MATFYLLPPRSELARQWTDALRQWFPGLDYPGFDLVDHIIAIAHRVPSVHAVFADELPDDGDARGALSAAFGAEPGDQVFDLRSGPLPSLSEWASGRVDIFATTRTAAC
jgi:hypothetical protein